MSCCVDIFFIVIRVYVLFHFVSRNRVEENKKKYWYDSIAQTNLTIIDSDRIGEKKPHELHGTNHQINASREKILTLVVINFSNRVRMLFFLLIFLCCCCGCNSFASVLWASILPHFHIGFDSLLIFFFTPLFLFVYISSTQMKLWEQPMRRREKNAHENHTHESLSVCQQFELLCGVFF